MYKKSMSVFCIIPFLGGNLELLTDKKDNIITLNDSFIFKV